MDVVYALKRQGRTLYGFGDTAVAAETPGPRAAGEETEGAPGRGGRKKAKGQADTPEDFRDGH
ncbi:hypothetical protein K1T71_015127 [Dendrolimus kikuchii]|nr:hypothetical protein K1T71_015127 [Dendrolimus kikuchii]